MVVMLHAAIATFKYHLPAATVHVLAPLPAAAARTVRAQLVPLPQEENHAPLLLATVIHASIPSMPEAVL